MSKEPIPSKLQNGDSESLRERSFCRWVSRDLFQAIVDFSKSTGLHSLYVEASQEKGRRAIFWNPPASATYEVRSARTREQFEEIHKRSCGSGRKLLSLHVSSENIYSAVWISIEHYDTAARHLDVFGIAPAQYSETT
ncbi:MAG: hypothetical protein ABI443_03145 [Chthoniobacterales bacterium]